MPYKSTIMAIVSVAWFVFLGILVGRFLLPDPSNYTLEDNFYDGTHWSWSATFSAREVNALHSKDPIRYVLYKNGVPIRYVLAGSKVKTECGIELPPTPPLNQNDR